MNTASAEERRAYFESIYDEHRRQVLAYCSRRTSSTEAADACSETFLVVWRRLEEVPQPPHALPYLYGIAARVLANQRRATVRRLRLGDKLRNLGTPPPSDPGALDACADRSRQVTAAVRRLKPTDREIVMLYAWEELPRPVIAEMMGMTKAAVDQRIHRSYQRLARVLENAEDRRHATQSVAQAGGTS